MIIRSRFFHSTIRSCNNNKLPLLRLEKAIIPNLHQSTPSLSISIPNSSDQLWAIISPPTSSSSGAKVMNSLIKVFTGKTRAKQETSKIHPSVHPFANLNEKRIGFASFSKSDQITSGGNDFQDYSKRYGALREEDNITLFESIMWDQGFEIGKVAEMQILPDKLKGEGVEEEVKNAARETKQHIERIAPLLGLHKPGPGSPGGVALLYQPIISLSNGQTRRARICGTLVSLARRQEGKNDESDKTTLMILDQPYSGLDEPSRDELSNLLTTLHNKGSPRAILVLRRQDEVPQGVTHIVDISTDGQVWTGSRTEWQGSNINLSEGVEGIRRNKDQRIGTGSPELGEIAMLKTVSVQYGEKVVLNSIDMALYPGSRMIIKGANGSGKTTLLSLLTGTHPQSYRFDDSSYRLFGQPRSSSSNATVLLNRRIGYFGPDLLAAFPRLGLEVGGLSVGQAIASGFDGVFSRTNVDEKRFDRIYCLAEIFEDCIGFREDRNQSEQQSAQNDDDKVYAMLRRPFIDLNAGSQALILFLRAIIHQPTLLILDEPFQGMDSVQIGRIREYLDASTTINSTNHQDAFAVGKTEEDRQIDETKRREMALVLVSHYVNEWPDRMGAYLLLEDGKVVDRI